MRESICRDCSSGKQTKAKQHHNRTTPEIPSSARELFTILHRKTTGFRCQNQTNQENQPIQIQTCSKPAWPNPTRVPTHPRPIANHNRSTPNLIGHVAPVSAAENSRRDTQIRSPASRHPCKAACNLRGCDQVCSNQGSQFVIGRNGILRLGRLPSIVAYQSSCVVRCASVALSLGLHIAKNVVKSGG